MGTIGAFVYAHKHHLHDGDGPGNLEDCMQAHIRLVTALTPACSHALPNVCLGRRAGDILVHNFRLLAPKATCRLVGDEFRGWVIFTDGGTHTRDEETSAGWTAIARSPFGVRYVMFGPVITAEAHVAFAGASQHTNNTAELSGITEALHFLSLMGPVP